MQQHQQQQLQRKHCCCCLLLLIWNVVVSMITDNWPHTDWSLADTTSCCCFVICLSIIQMFKHDVYGMLGDEEIQDEHSMLVSSNIKQLNAELEGATRLRPLSVSRGWKTWDHRPNTNIQTDSNNVWFTSQQQLKRLILVSLSLSHCSSWQPKT